MPARGRRPAVELEDEAWELVDDVPLGGWENDLGDAVLCDAVATAAVVGTPLASAKALDDDDDDGGFDFVDGARAASSTEKDTKVNAVSSAAAAASLVSASSEELTAASSTELDASSSSSSSPPPCASGYWYSRHALVVVLSLFAAVAIGGRPSSSLSPHSRLPLSPSSPARPTDGNGTVALLERCVRWSRDHRRTSPFSVSTRIPHTRRDTTTRCLHQHPSPPSGTAYRRVAAMERELELERAPPHRPLHRSEPSAAAAGEETPPADARRLSGEMVAAATNAARSAEEEDDEAAAAEEEDDDAAAAAAEAYSRQFARLPTTEAHVGIACGPGSYYLDDPTVTRR